MFIGKLDIFPLCVQLDHWTDLDPQKY